MLAAKYQGGFKRDIKLAQKRGLDLNLLQSIINLLMQEIPLPEKCRDHTLSGKWSGFRECHIQPDWLLIYRIEENSLWLARTGTHSDLFR